MYSRRGFLLRALLLAATARMRSLIARDEPHRTAALSDRELKLLQSALDEIIPAGEGMPSATKAGTLAYLRHLAWQHPSIADELHGSLEMLAAIVLRTQNGAFDSLPHVGRVDTLKLARTQHALAFSILVGYVYEAYYTRPQVLGLISCSSQPAEEEDRDLERLLAPVRKMENVFREVR